MGSASRTALIHPETLIDDRPIRFGSYAPENFDLTFQGTVTVRKALQLSLNVPAVAVLDAVRASRLTTRLAQAGAPLVLPKGEAARASPWGSAASASGSSISPCSMPGSRGSAPPCR